MTSRLAQALITALIVAPIVAMAAPSAARAQTPPCRETPQTRAARILGTDDARALSDSVRPFVAGERSFRQRLDNGWVFALVRRDRGWSVRVYENDRPDAADLTDMTPPFRGAPNPRDVFGWHFRNEDNTGPNDGSVNAPQDLRAFVISPALAGAGGFRPPPEAVRITPNTDDGVGWLKVLDYGLADLAAGERARMNYLKFDACLSWRRDPAERDRLLDAASLDFTAEDREVFGACGLDLDAYDLHAAFAPRVLGGDIDGDGALRAKRIFRFVEP
ncbi:MAG: hypothetical protein ACFB00_04635 [Parvularculaceae bacterium]